MNRLNDSLRRIMDCDKPLLGELFYAKLFAAYPAARVFFEHTNMQMQVHILINGLQVAVALAGENYPAARSYLKVVGHRHYQRQIPTELYPLFCDAMLATLREFHTGEWTPELEQEWRRALEASVAAMLEGYTREPVFY